MLVGASVGAAIALLYAPAPGSETREQVRTVANDAKDRATEMASTIRDKAPEVAGKAQDIANQVKTAATSAVGKATEVASTLRDKVPGFADKAQETVSHVRDQVADIAQTVQDKVQSATGGGNGNLPDTDSGNKTKKRDLHELETSDDPDVVTDRINDAMQGSGEEAHEIAEQLAQAPGGSNA
jgi:gas vesicle protein